MGGVLYTRAMRIAVVMAVALAPAPACSRHRSEGESTGGAEKALPPITVRDDTADLWLTWVDEKGDTHTAIHPADVPAAARGRVRVVLGDREEGTRGLFYVADLTQAKGDGAYPVTTLPRRTWEEDLEKRRGAFLATVTPRAESAPSAADPTNAPPAATGDPAVIIYGASWCGACHEAANYLKAKHVPYVLKDIEATPAAAAEMQEKLAKAGRRGGSIPVIDVGGQIMVGFAPGAMDAALRQANVTRRL